MKIRKKVFIHYFHFVSWWHINLGLHLDISLPQIEIHVPFGFFRIGLSRMRQAALCEEIGIWFSSANEILANDKEPIPSVEEGMLSA